LFLFLHQPPHISSFQLALKALEACTQNVKRAHEQNRKISKVLSGSVSVPAGAGATSPATSSSNEAGSAAAGGGKSDWTSWAMEGLTKSMEKVTSDDVSSEVGASKTPSLLEKDHNKLSTKADESRSPLFVDQNLPTRLDAVQSQSSYSNEGWGEGDDMDLDDLLDDQPVVSPCKDPAGMTSKKAAKIERRTAGPKKSRKESTVKKMSVDNNENESWDDF
jgi:hypothetical protein